MNLWHTLTKPIPLSDGRAAAARIAVRFVFCTFPYFALAFLLNAAGNDRLLTSGWSVWVLAIPIFGGLIDCYRLHLRTKEAAPVRSTTSVTSPVQH